MCSSLNPAPLLTTADSGASSLTQHNSSHLSKMCLNWTLLRELTIRVKFHSALLRPPIETIHVSLRSSSRTISRRIWTHPKLLRRDEEVFSLLEEENKILLLKKDIVCPLMLSLVQTKRLFLPERSVTNLKQSTSATVAEITWPVWSEEKARSTVLGSLITTLSPNLAQRSSISAEKRAYLVVMPLTQLTSMSHQALRSG